MRRELTSMRATSDQAATVDQPFSLASPFGEKFAYLHGSDAETERLTAQRRQTHHKGTTDVMQLSGMLHQLKEFHVTRNYFRRPARFDLDKYDCLFNIVSDPDTNADTLRLMSRILRDYKGRVINDPTTIAGATRDAISRRLAGIPGVIAPLTIRLPFVNERSFRAAVAASGLALPVIAREVGTHNGRVLGLFDTLDALIPALQRRTRYYLTQFARYASGRDGHYRKYRFFFFGRCGVLRHLVISDRWNVHVSDRARLMHDRPALLDEERQAIANGMEGLAPIVRKGLEAIRQRVAIDYFGLDCSISDDGEITCFEATPAMSFFPRKEDVLIDYIGPAYQRGREAFRALVAGEG